MNNIGVFETKQGSKYIFDGATNMVLSVSEELA